MAEKKNVKKQKKAKTLKPEVSMSDLLPKLEDLNINVVKCAKRTALKKDGKLQRIETTCNGCKKFKISNFF